MRADRLISILLLLQTNQRLTSRELAQRLGVSERTIHRDMEALSTSGIPIFADRGRSGGWSLLEGYRVQLNGLAKDEIQALFLGQSAHSFGLQNNLQTAMIKLLAALPESARPNAEFTRKRIHIDGAGWFGNYEDAHMLRAVQEAIWSSRYCTIIYNRADGNIIERIIEPLGLVAKGVIWYLVARSGEDIRTYRISRIKKIEFLDHFFSYPNDFDLAAYWEDSVSRFKVALPRYLVHLYVKAEILHNLSAFSRYATIEKTIPSEHDGWVNAFVNFEVFEEALSAIVLMGESAKVIEPIALRQQIIEQIEAILKIYDDEHNVPEEE